MARITYQVLEEILFPEIMYLDSVIDYFIPIGTDLTVKTLEVKSSFSYLDLCRVEFEIFGIPAYAYIRESRINSLVSLGKITDF